MDNNDFTCDPNWKEISPEDTKRLEDFWDTGLTVPEPSGWECELFGTNRNIVLLPAKGDVPNWFWRWMQYICFGNKWKKVKNAAEKEVQDESLL